MPEHTIQSRRARIYGTLRTAHLERAAALAPAAIIYQVRRYDFDEHAAQGLELIQVSGGEAARIVARSPIESLEINEPLMLASLPTTVRVLFALRRRRPKPLVVSYLIGNADPFDPETASGWRTRVRRRLERRAAAWVWRRLDRVVYGTPAAEQTYRQLLGPAAGESTLIPALPAPCDRAGEPAAIPGHVVFLGAFVPRKGIEVLMKAWQRVASEYPLATLTVVGKGALLEDIVAWSAGHASVDLVVDPSRDRIHELLASAQVLVLPSQHTRTWREQVGLPIVEGLAHGCSIVTTSETGLAEWLGAHGHGIVADSADPDALASTIVEQLLAARPAAEILAQLPARDGRLEADDWLFRDAAATSHESQRIA